MTTTSPHYIPGVNEEAEKMALEYVQRNLGGSSMGKLDREVIAAFDFSKGFHRGAQYGYSVANVEIRRLKEIIEAMKFLQRKLAGE